MVPNTQSAADGLSPRLEGPAVSGLKPERERAEGQATVMLAGTASSISEASTEGVSPELSERCKTEETLRLKDHRFESIFSAVGEGLVLQDVSGKISEANTAAEQILGLSRAQLLGHDWLDLGLRAIRVDGSAFPAEDHPSMQVLRSGSASRNLVVGVNKPGAQLVWLSINAQPVFGVNGSLEGVVCTFIDVTHRRHQESQLRSTMMEIINLKSALDEHAIVAVTDQRGVITYVNERFCQLSQYRSAELVGKTHGMINSGQHPKVFFADLWQTIQSGKVWHGEICNRAQEGGLFWVETTIVPFLDTKGCPEQYIAIRNDITERKRLENDLAKARDAALEHARLKSEFLATMSHEIRTPMNGVIGMTELLLSSITDEEQLKMGRTIQACATNLLVILNDILDFSKIEAGRLEISSEPFSPEEQVLQTLELFSPHAREKQISLSSEFEEGAQLPRIGDAARLRQILSNLVGNALKFTPTGSVHVRVFPVELAAAIGGLRFEVRDSGIGISDTVQQRLFSPFVQGDGSVTRRFGGTGLGLAICRRLVELMQGSLGVESKEGEGSLFWFQVPLPLWEAAPVIESDEPSFVLEKSAIPLASRVDEKGLHKTIASPNVPPPPSSDRAPLRLLLAEDNEVNQTVVTLMLKRLGEKADIVVNGEEALQKLGKQEYDVLLLDCQMPVLDGYRTAQIIREGSRPGIRRDLHIIALTAYAMAEDRQRCVDAGMDDYLSKPIGVKDLSEALERARCLLP